MSYSIATLASRKGSDSSQPVPISTQISNCDNLLYSEYFYSFLSSEEHNEAVSHIKLSRYDEAHPLLEVQNLNKSF